MMNAAEDDEDFENAATMPQLDRRLPMDAAVICKRIDALCGSWDDPTVADRFGVELELVTTIRHEHNIDMSRGELLRLVAGLASATGASADWILGWTDVIIRRAPLIS